MEGVLWTRIGMLKGREVVEVHFDGAVVDWERLVAMAVEMDCCDRVFGWEEGLVDRARAVAKVEGAELVEEEIDATTQQQYDLAQVPSLYYLPLTRSQATKVNADVKAAGKWLSPGQEELRKKLKGVDGEKLKGLRVDRTVEGLPGYAKAVDEIVK